MQAQSLKQIVAGMLLTMIALPFPVFAQQTSKSSQKPLSEKENPLMIGKRDLNKHQWNFYSMEKEVALGRQVAADVDRGIKLIDDPVVTEYVNRVGQNIVLHSDAKVPFTIKVVDTDEVNAFALPGGFFYVNKGLVLAADNEAEIAGVMAHEIAHVAARHAVEQATKGELVNLGTIPLIFLGGWLGYGVRQAAGLIIPLGFLKFSRGAEAEADMLGVQYAWAAGYDPNGLITFFEKLDAKEKKKPGTISTLFRTHPPTQDRLAGVRDLLNRFPEREEYTLNTSDFTRVKSRLMAITNTRKLEERESGPKRPTLRRRTGNPDEEGKDQQQKEQPKEKPKLQKKDGPPDKP